MCLPSEILEHIAQDLSIPGDFSSIRPFSETCKLFRAVVLRVYCRNLYACTKIQSIPDAYSALVRKLVIPAHLYTNPVPYLPVLTHLSASLSQISYTGVFGCINTIARSLPRSLRSLTLTSIPLLSPVIVRVLASSDAENLVALHLSCVNGIHDVSCWNCWQEQIGDCAHSPIPNMFKDVVTLAAAFGAVLRPLKKLRTLHLGVYLSDADLISQHNMHSINGHDRSSSPSPPSPSSLDADFDLPSSPASTQSFTNNKKDLCGIHSDVVPYGPGSCRHFVCKEAFQITSLREAVGAGIICRTLGYTHTGMEEEKAQLSISWGSLFH